MQDLPDGTIDVDHQAPAFIADRHDRYAELRERCPVVFNQHYGGFWMVTDYESVVAVARDNETFAHKYEPDAGDGISYHGICGIPRPPYVPRMGVSEIDGPEHADLRRVLNPPHDAPGRRAPAAPHGGGLVLVHRPVRGGRRGRPRARLRHAGAGGADA